MFNFNSIKFKLIIAPITSILIGIVVLILVINLSAQNAINKLSQTTITEAETLFNSLEKSETQKLSATLQVLLQQEQFRTAFLEKDRDKLYSLTSKLFKSLKDNYNITHWYFIEPEPSKKCFLRVHNKPTHSDTITRATYEASLKNKKFGAGKELGKTAFALRVVHPYYDANNQLIGYMELGQEIDHFFEIMKK